MKSPVAVALIIIGGLLILAPILADHQARAQIVSLMAEQKLTTVNLNPPPMGSMYRLGCFAAGSVMIAAAVLMSRPASGLPK